ncbi:hypothetical protein CDAR_29221 [Caerostris darwini]|uniref:Uncharacterized protein n=1 Tax=Caerostris darwini TaxID=1538125 RepID=A0AAV4S2M5_9ARAC|nr:hypothetical protein CDAR_29221 [Caerostris darwini]
MVWNGYRSIGMMPRVFILRGGLHVESDDTLVRAAEPEPRSPAHLPNHFQVGIRISSNQISLKSGLLCTI